MDLTRTAVSKFPRQAETPSDCLMAAFTGWSGNRDILAYGPDMITGWRPYSFLRLRHHLYADWLTPQMVSGSFGSISSSPDPVPLPMLGAFPYLVGNPHRFMDGYAPEQPESTTIRSTSPSVDSAGWTEVVILEGHFVFSYVDNGHRAEVNASIDCVPEVAPPGSYRLLSSGGVPSDKRTCGCTDQSDMNDSKFSCLSFNEVTK
jgi:hypothetical protein